MDKQKKTNILTDIISNVRMDRVVGLDHVAQLVQEVLMTTGTRACPLSLSLAEHRPVRSQSDGWDRDRSPSKLYLLHERLPVLNESIWGKALGLVGMNGIMHKRSCTAYVMQDGSRSNAVLQDV